MLHALLKIVHLLSFVLWIGGSQGYEVVSQASSITALVFGGLTVYVLYSGKDFSWMGGMLRMETHDDTSDPDHFSADCFNCHDVAKFPNARSFRIPSSGTVRWRSSSTCS